MTPNKQVSPAIRILRGERDASARATHLEAATRKFLVTTNERKQMSTKTNFKRIALVAVAALGLGVLSSVPATAASSGITLTVVDGTSNIVGGKSDSTNAATFTISGLLGAGDSLIAYITQKSIPTAESGTATTVVPVFYNLDSTTPTLSTLSIESGNSTNAAANGFRVQDSLVAFGTADTFQLAGKAALRAGGATQDTLVALSSAGASTGAGIRLSSTADANISSKFGLQLDTGLSTVRTPGTYTYTVTVKLYEKVFGATTVNVTTYTKDVNIVIAALNYQTVTIAPGSSTAFIGTATAATSDAAISALATASTTPAAYVRVNTYNSTGQAKPESITATISGAGLLSFGSVSGASLTIAGTGSSDISILPDGRSGNATITISTTTRNFPAKTMSFYAQAPATLVASVSAPLAAVGTNTDVVRVTATDSAGINWAGTLYIYASSATDAAVAGAVRATAASSAIACTLPTSTQPAHVCPVTGNTAGTAKMKVSTYATAALATAAASGAEVTSNEVSVVVSAASVDKVKIEFDKATYAPGERARIYVTPLDSSGKAIAAATYSNLFASGGISTASALTFAGSTTTADSLTAVSITTKATSSSTSGARAGSFEYTVYMPTSGGTVTISATGGTSLPVAGRVAVTASATVTDSGAAALAAVNALATTVASLKTLITTLTNLVLKIQKKVKA